jgi:hypothetical protein
VIAAASTSNNHGLTVVVRIALALEILLVCVEGVIPASRGYLPLGRSHLAQLWLVLGLAVMTVEIWESLSHAKLGGWEAPIAGTGTGIPHQSPATEKSSQIKAPSAVRKS